jgi:ATP/maltotriose-dependent transcriptional regulator MalT
MATDTGHPAAGFLEQAHTALATGAWEVARSWFEQALDQHETPEALEGLATAAWWQNDVAATFRARARAYHLYRECGDRLGAARVAAFHAVDYCSLRNAPAVASGWIRRARRMLEDLSPSPEHAMVAAWEGHIALATGQGTSAAHRLCAEATAIAQSIGAIDWEMVALAVNGMALVIDGAVSAGMRCLDEAATAAVAGEMTDLDAIGTVCCYLIHACEQARDFDRAAQWCEVVREVSAQWSSRLVFSLCRTHYAGVLIGQGAWQEAEAELTTAVSELATIHPIMAAEGIARLAELRRRQGRLEEAAALFQQADGHPLRRLASSYVLLGRTALALDMGDAVTAADLAECFLREVGDERQIDRVRGLELFVRAQAALGQEEPAFATLGALHSISTSAETVSLRAAASLSEGVIAATHGDEASARRRFEDAVGLFERSGAPYEAALARLDLAGVLTALGRHDAAEKEAGTALECLRGIGAGREIKRAVALLDQIEVPKAPHHQTKASLTPRESEVLRLVAQGLTNKEIAAELTLSRHTVHRHLANILTKLDLPSRAAAAAFAARRGAI